MSLTLTTTTTNLVLNNGASLCSKQFRHRRRKLLSPLPPPSLMTLSSKPFSSYGCAAMPFIFTDRNNFSRVRSMQPQDTGNASDASLSDSNADRHNIVADNMIEDSKTDTNNPRSSFLAKLALALGVAATITFISVGFRWPIQGSSSRVPFLVDGSLTSTPVAPSTSFTFKAFGYQFVLPQYAPGWVYFWLLMAAGCGLFVSEEALNIWVGTSLARLLTVDGTWKSFAESFSRNTPYIISTVLWVYWGVCISDMIPFYVGRFFRQSGASEDVCSKLGIGKEKAASVTRAVQRYGNLIGFVERFSVGARNPTSFLAGALGISAECFFAGVCCGGLVTLPVQLGIGFLLRERPVVALASVATVVGIWSVFPYVMAALTALFLFLRQRYSG